MDTTHLAITIMHMLGTIMFNHVFLLGIYKPVPVLKGPTNYALMSVHVHIYIFIKRNIIKNNPPFYAQTSFLTS